jgi:poly(A) polymerase
LPKHYALDTLAIHPKQLDAFGLEIIDTLKQKKHQGYFVGGCIRDLLAQKHPKDFDIVTNAQPKQIKKLFKKAFIIGRRFRLVHIYQVNTKHFIEVATFRSEPSQFSWSTRRLRRLQNNTFGKIHTDVMRRDLTINALYLNPDKKIIIDYVGGIEDFKKRQIRMIGEPNKRLIEDPIRVLRAIRFAAKLQFKVELELAQAIQKKKHLLFSVSKDRVMIEVQRLFCHGFAQKSWRFLVDHALIPVLFSQLMLAEKQQKKWMAQLIPITLADADYYYQQGANPAVPLLLAGLYWPYLEQYCADYQPGKKKHKRPEAWGEVVDLISHLLTDMQQCIKIPHYMQTTIKTIWLDQFYLNDFQKNKVFLKKKHCFGLSCHLLKMRAEAKMVSQSLCDQWYFWKNNVKKH